MKNSTGNENLKLAETISLSTSMGLTDESVSETNQ